MELDNTILYELICCAEWVSEKEVACPFPPLSTRKNGILSYLNPMNFVRNQPLTSAEASVWLKSVGPTWQYAVTSDGKIVAILQDTLLETRSSKDNFSSVLGKSHVTKDEFPNYRRMAWSKDSSLLAIAFTNGIITCFDVMASPMFSVQRFDAAIGEDASKLSCSTELGLSGLFFVEERLRKTTCCSELVTVDKRGIVKAYRQQNPDQTEFHHQGSFRQFYPFGVADAQFSDNLGIIVVAGMLHQDSNSEKPHWKHGITIWRLLLDHPYYKIINTLDADEFKMDAKRLWKMACSIAVPNAQFYDFILKMSFSPSGNLLAALHTSGTISIWQVPSLKLVAIWPLRDQFHYNIANHRFNYNWRKAFNQSQSRMMDPLMFHPYDINWWTEESLTIARANGTVTLVPVSVHPDRNLLGDLPELFESPVRISPRFGKSLFVLESEVNLSSNDSSQKSESESWLRTGMEELLFWMTDIERFRPPRKRKKKLPAWNYTNRLYTLRNITPLELFHRKIEQEEYGDALDLGKLYKLDLDLVYQRQWTRNPVSIHSIKNFLAKISKRNWVLQECLDRVPESVDAARELLQFGLKGTDLTVAVLISQGKDKGKFILWTPDDLESTREQYLSLVDGSNDEVIRLLRYRKRFLHFLDVLDSYEEIVGGSRKAEEVYDSKAYGALRNRPIVESAIEMAQNLDTNGLRILLTNHWDDLSSNYFDIISSFPESSSPYVYKDFLPGFAEDGTVVLWTQVTPKSIDWCEKFTRKTLHSQLLSVTSFTPELIEQWYQERCLEIERESGVISFALDLGLLGIERNVLELRLLVQELQTLETIVYEVQIPEMTLTTFKALSDQEKLRTLLSNSTDDTLISDFRYFVIPFLSSCDDKEADSSFKLLNQYLMEIAAKTLKPVLKIFEASRQEEIDPLIPNPKDLLLLAHNCIYKYEGTEETDIIVAILDSLPERGLIKKSPSIENLYCRMDDLEDHFRAIQRLRKYLVPLTVENIKEISKDPKPTSVEQFFVSICHYASKVVPQLKVNDWKSLLYDMLEIRKKLFKEFQLEKCFEIYVASLLQSGHPDVIQLAKDFIEKSPVVKNDLNRNSSEYSATYSLFLYVIPYDKGVDMIIEAAQMYFDASSSYADPDMELCRMCLQLVQSTKEPRIAYMFDILDAVKIINKDFRLNALPHAVRISTNKFGLIKQAMEKSKFGYKKIQQLLKLVLYLHVDGMTMEEGESIVLEMAGDAALMEGDTKHAMQICDTIIAKEYKSGWKIFTYLAKLQSHPPIMDSDTATTFINFALSVCPDSEIFTVLNAKYLIEIRTLQTRVMQLSPEDSATEVKTLEAQKNQSVLENKLNRIQLDEFLKTTARWISPLKEMAVAIKTTGVSRDLNQASFISPSHYSNDDFDTESYPAFDLTDSDSSHIHISYLSYTYNSFSNSATVVYNSSNPVLEHCILLNRIWHLEKHILGSEETVLRDKTILEQLVLRILPEDIPWGLAILFSIQDSLLQRTLPGILNNLPKTPVSVLVCLYFFALRIQMEILGLKSVTNDNLHTRNPNRVIAQTRELLEGDDPESEENAAILSFFCKLFRKYSKILNEF